LKSVTILSVIKTYVA